MEQHHGVYERLVNLTRLNFLDLGFENQIAEVDSDNEVLYEDEGRTYVDYEAPAFDTLKLSLASGMDRLGVLRDLEVFGFE
ncbi:hypothetical protein BGZ74_003433, partial [Mortierella antarctica]